MKKVRSAIIAGACIIGMGSCTVMHTAVVTNNPVGTKKYVMKSKPFKKDQGLSYSEAMKKGKITKLGVAELKVKWAIILIPTLTITGE